MRDEKSKQLEMSSSTASQRLRKAILFQLVQATGRDICFHCHEKIKDKEALSIEHKIPWMYSRNPKKNFFDLENITFSHTKCNYSSRRKGFHGYKSLEYERKHLSQTGFKGVYLHPAKRKSFQAKISINNKAKSLGYFNTPEEAAKVYDRAMIGYRGNAGVTNLKLGFI